MSDEGSIIFCKAPNDIFRQEIKVPNAIFHQKIKVPNAICLQNPLQFSCKCSYNLRQIATTQSV